MSPSINQSYTKKNKLEISKTKKSIMTDYKALYEAKVEEVEKLKEAIVSQNIRKIKELRGEINQLKAENQDLQLRAPYPVEYYDYIIATLQEEVAELKAKNNINSEEIKKLEGLREIIRKELGCEPDPTQETILGAIKKLNEAREWIGYPNKFVCNEAYDEVIDQVGQLQEEIKKLKGEKKKKKTSKTPDGVMSAFAGLRSSWMEDEERYYSENYSEHKEKYDDEPSNIPTKYLHDCNYTDLRILDDWLSKREYHPYEIDPWENPNETEDGEIHGF